MIEDGALHGGRQQQRQQARHLEDEGHEAPRAFLGPHGRPGGRHHVCAGVDVPGRRPVPRDDRHRHGVAQRPLRGRRLRVPAGNPPDGPF